MRAVPAEVAGATRAMFFTRTSALPILRGPTVAYAPEDDGGGAAPEPGADGGDAASEDDDFDAVEVDENGDPIEPEEDYDEVEYGEGKKFKLPRELNRGFLREADYTQKTQALAKEREAFATERSQQAEMTQAHRAQIGRVQAAQDRVEKFKSIPWDQLQNEDRDTWRDLRDDYDVARDQLREAQADLAKSETEYQAKEAEAQNTRLAAVNAELADPVKGIPGWSQEMVRDLSSFAGQYGVDTDDLLQFSASHWRLLHLAKEGLAARNRQQRVTQHQKAQETRPAAPIKGNGVVRRLSDDMSTAEWMKKRNADAAKARG